MKKFLLRMDDAMHEAVKHQSVDQHTTMNDIIVRVLRMHFTEADQELR